MPLLLLAISGWCSGIKCRRWIASVLPAPCV
jgi:hypothetical protein